MIFYIILIIIIFLFILNLNNLKENFTPHSINQPYFNYGNSIDYNLILGDMHYNKSNPQIYYPISSPLDDYFNNLNSISSSHLSILRSILNAIIIKKTNITKPIIFNYYDNPTKIVELNKKIYYKLANIIINLINENNYNMVKVELIRIDNELSESINIQQRIIFDMIINYKINDVLDNKNKTITIQPTFIIEKINEKPIISIKDLFNNKLKHKLNLTNLIVVGSSNYGFYLGAND